jgi:hypothetical protein
LSVSLNHEWLASEISASPIIDKNSVWSGNIGIAYNNDIFRGPEYGEELFRSLGFEFRIGMYNNQTDSKIIQAPADGSPPEEIDVEDVLGVNRRKSIIHFEGVWRFAHFHRLEVGHFQLGRDSETTLLTDILLDDEVFPEGTRINVDAELRVTKVAYGFSLMNDAQKELGILAGVHITNYEALVVAPDTGQRVETSISTPLPVIGVYGSVALGPRTDLSANVQLFRMEFDHYSGSLNNLYLGLTHYFSDSIGAGLGYNLYLMNCGTMGRSCSRVSTSDEAGNDVHKAMLGLAARGTRPAGRLWRAKEHLPAARAGTAFRSGNRRGAGRDLRK